MPLLQVGDSCHYHWHLPPHVYTIYDPYLPPPLTTHIYRIYQMVIGSIEAGDFYSYK